MGLWASKVPRVRLRAGNTPLDWGLLRSMPLLSVVRDSIHSGGFHVSFPHQVMSHFIWNQKKQYGSGRRPYSLHWLSGPLLSKPWLRGHRPDNGSSLCDAELGWTKSQPTDLKAKWHTAGPQHMCGWRSAHGNDHGHIRCGDAMGLGLFCGWFFKFL